MTGDVILRKGDAWLKFAHPRRVIVTEMLGDVHRSLAEVEALVNENGWTAVGFVSYDAAPAFDPAMKVIASQGFPLLWFGLYDSIETLEAPGDFGSPPPLHWVPDTERETYNAAIQSIKERIAEGRTYQVNYTMRLHLDFEADSRALFGHLAHSQNKYAAFLDIGDWAVCSASHELFFDLDGDIITGRPMKGTVKRGRTTQEDASISSWLHASIKNRAENVMIVDMIRNDIGRIAKVGSVHVPDLFTIEKYPTLFQMTSTIQAKTQASVADIFDALFPCASITGAPKVSTMSIIAELETSPRRVYCGAIGYIAPNRKARFNVAIRTALVDKQNHRAEYGVGGGIVWDSTSADEYSEALLKARVLTDPPQKDFSLFETLLWTPREGYFLLERHIARIMESAEYFGFATKNIEKNIRAELSRMTPGANSPKRVKLLLYPNGELDSEIRDFQPDERTFRACIAREPVNSNDRFLFHKTMKRDVYEKATIPNFDDVLLFNENRELTEFTIGNLVAKIHGELVTPPISCGLLAGTFRAELIASEKIRERIIRVEELETCEEIYLINSLRKWVKVKLREQPAH